tara:strand:- start:364 stop:510 length:147 start_codon:yes stop_codon:yes gene_type:complete
MTKNEKSAKLHELSSKIRELKLSEITSNIRTKKTIQKLQQEMDDILNV